MSAEMQYRAELIQVAAVAVAMIEDLGTGRRTTLREVREEREAQEEKWGSQHHAPMEWLAILGEEFGEACKAALESHEWPEERHRAMYEAERLRGGPPGVMCPYCPNTIRSGYHDSACPFFHPIPGPSGSETEVGLLAYRGKKDCWSVVCTQHPEMRKSLHSCYGWHCSECDQPSSQQGHAVGSPPEFRCPEVVSG